MTQNLSDNAFSSAEEKLEVSQEAEVFLFPTSFAQQRLWFLDRLFPGNSFYNFELGGDSLLAVRLIAQIHQQFERELPLSALFLTPTIEGLASTLEQKMERIMYCWAIPYLRV